MERDFKLFCFDMDGTLITNTNSVRYLCALNNKEEQLLEIEEREDNKEYSYNSRTYSRSKRRW